jgi:hypothetical protein
LSQKSASKIGSMTSFTAILQLREQSRVPSLGPGYAVPFPQTVLWTPPTPTMAHRDFGIPYTQRLMLLWHHHSGSPALRCSSSTTCHPCYPGRSQRPLPFFEPLGVGLPHSSTGSASSGSLTRLHLGSLTLRPAALLIGNLRPPVTRAPLP